MITNTNNLLSRNSSTYNMAGEVSKVNKGQLDNSIFNHDELDYMGIKNKNNHS